MKRQDIMLPKLRANVEVASSTFNAEERTLEVRFYSGASVQRFPMFDEPYELSFSLDSKAVRLERFNAGAPVVDNHRDHGSVRDAVIGVVEKAWLEADGGHARIRFSARDDVAPIIQDVKDGILRNFSMGAVIHEIDDVTEKGAKQRSLLATQWTPMELSVVPVPADPGAQALASAERFPCHLTGASAPEERTIMDKIKVRLLATGETVEIEENEFDEKLHSKELDADVIDLKSARRAVDDSIEADKAYAKEVRRLAAHHNLDEHWVKKHLMGGTPILQVINDALQTRKDLAPVDPRISMGEDFEAIGWKTERMADALAARAQRKPAPDAASSYALSSIAECALECLALNGRARGRQLDARRNADEIVKLALHTTSDFPLLLANVLNKQVQPAYDLAMPTYRQIAARRTFNDFRPHRFLKTGDFPVPLQVNEHGEFKHGTMSESHELVTAVSYGRIFGITRQTLVNDDVNAFADIGGAAGRRVADFENSTFFATCILAAAGLGPTLVEGGVAVYNSAHGNLTSAGALSNTLLGEALAKMLAQTSLDGLKLNVMPKLLVVSPTSYVLAKTLLAAITPNQASQVNPFAGEMMALTDANLTGARFYVLADPGSLPNYIYGTLGDGGGPRTEVRTGFEVDGVEVKLSLDFGCGAIDFRGGVTGAGS